MSRTSMRIFDIGRYRNEDGPGIRTIVFLKGCPLRCRWCSNPFGLSVEKQLALNQSKCSGCGACIPVCEAGACQIKDGRASVNYDRCTVCGRCIEVCRPKARSIVGEEKTVDEVFEILRKDAVFYRRSRGGITLSGGEVLLQHEAAAELLKKCRSHLFLSTAIETSAFGSWENLKEVVQFCDVVFVDLKHMDDRKHREYTGVPVDPILDNIRKLCMLKQERKSLKVIIRRPIIKGINDDDETSVCAAQFIAALPGSPEVNLIPYHNLGEVKFEMIGKDYTLAGLERMGNNAVEIGRVKKLTEKYAPDNFVSIGGGNLSSG